MAIIVKLDTIMTEKNIRLYELAHLVHISIANLSHLRSGKARAIRFSTLEALCDTLHCQPGDILKYQYIKELDRKFRVPDTYSSQVR